MNQTIKHLENGDFEVMKDTKKLIKTLDKYFSQFIRLRDTDSQGYGNCITCHKELKWSDGNETHNGHFATRNNMSTRWDERNCNIQCNYCNTFRHGEQFKHGEYIDWKYGKGTAESIMIKSKQVVKYLAVELEEMIDYYKKEVKRLKAEKNL